MPKKNCLLITQNIRDTHIDTPTHIKLFHFNFHSHIIYAVVFRIELLAYFDTRCHACHSFPTEAIYRWAGIQHTYSRNQFTKTFPSTVVSTNKQHLSCRCSSEKLCSTPTTDPSHESPILHNSQTPIITTTSKHVGL